MQEAGTGDADGRAAGKGGIEVHKQTGRTTGKEGRCSHFMCLRIQDSKCGQDSKVEILKQIPNFLDDCPLFILKKLPATPTLTHFVSN